MHAVLAEMHSMFFMIPKQTAQSKLAGQSDDWERNLRIFGIMIPQHSMDNSMAWSWVVMRNFSARRGPQSLPMLVSRRLLFDVFASPLDFPHELRTTIDGDLYVLPLRLDCAYAVSLCVAANV